MSKINSENCAPPLEDSEVIALVKSAFSYAEQGCEKTCAVKLFEICIEKGVYVFLRADTGEIYCRFPVDKDRYQIESLQSDRFKTWLVEIFFIYFGKDLKPLVLSGAISLLKTLAYKNPHQKVFVRWGWYEGKIYCDLADRENRVIEIDSYGWRILEKESPIYFLRTPHMEALPVPSGKGNWEALRPFINTDDNDFAFIVAWLISSCVDNPHYVLVIISEQGAGKSVLAQFLVSLLDPRLDDLLSPFDKTSDLYAVAAGRYVVSVNNISSISAELSDDFCRLSDGGAFSKRKLYSDNESLSINLRRPMVFNGITAFPDRPDLLERSLVVEPLPIGEDKRCTEKKLFADLEHVKPEILAALFDSISAAIWNKDYTPLKVGRRADAETFVRRAAQAGALPFTEEDFVQALQRLDESKIDEALQNSEVASKIFELGANYIQRLQNNPLITLLDSYGSKGQFQEHDSFFELQIKPQELIDEIIKSAPDSRFLVKTPRALYNHLRRIESLLRKRGVTWRKIKKTDTNYLCIAFLKDEFCEV